MQARAAGEIDAEHFTQFALIGRRRRPHVMDAFHAGAFARDQHAQPEVLRAAAVRQQISQLKLAFFQPVDRRQQHQMRVALAVAQMQQGRPQIRRRYGDEAEIGALFGQFAEREKLLQSGVERTHRGFL